MSWFITRPTIEFMDIYGGYHLRHLCYAPKSFGMIVETIIFGDPDSTLWLSSIWQSNI